eukprot:10587558-Ditylum_brightwellii.AAC.1
MDASLHGKRTNQGHEGQHPHQAFAKNQNLLRCRHSNHSTTPQDDMTTKIVGGHPISTATPAAMDLSVYIVGLMSEEEVVDLNINVMAVDIATNTTAADSKATKLKSTMLLDTAEWFNNIKAYVNLIFAFFGALCPHYFQMCKVVTNLHELKAEAHKAISPKSKAAILWIILLQSPHVMQSNMDVLTEFSTVQAALVAKSTYICHAELPRALVPVKCKHEDKDEG